MKDVCITFILLSLLAEIIGTVGGFGSSVFFVPIANFYFDFHSVLGLTAIFHLFSNISKIMLFRKGLNKRLLIYIGVPSILFVVLGGVLSNSFKSFYLEVILGVFLLVFSLLFLIKRQLEVTPSNRNAIAGGALSGFSAGLLGTGGAIRGLTMAALNLDKSAFIATSALIDFMIDFSRTIVYYQNGYIQMEHLKYVPYLLAIGIVGSFLGKKLLEYIPQSKFRRLSLFFVFVIGIVMLGKLFISK